MPDTKKIALWLDHAKAHFITLRENEIETVESPRISHYREDGQSNNETQFAPHHFSNNESREHNTKNNEDAAYFSNLEKKLAAYDNILLFGPTNAKDQLHNLLKGNKSFSSKKIAVMSSDKLSDNQMIEFAKRYFGTN